MRENHNSMQLPTISEELPDWFPDRCEAILPAPIPTFDLFQEIDKSPFFQGQISAQGILHLQNPNLGSNSDIRLCDSHCLREPKFRAEFWETNFGRPNFGDTNSRVKCLILCFPAQEDPRKFTLEKFTFQSSTQKSGQKIHIAPLQGRLTKAHF